MEWGRARRKGRRILEERTWVGGGRGGGVQRYGKCGGHEEGEGEGGREGRRGERGRGEERFLKFIKAVDFSSAMRSLQCVVVVWFWF